MEDDQVCEVALAEGQRRGSYVNRERAALSGAGFIDSSIINIADHVQSWPGNSGQSNAKAEGRINVK